MIDNKKVVRINTFIQKQNPTIDELELVARFIRDLHGTLERIHIFDFKVGETVKFLGRHGMFYQGRVTKINLKTVTVKAKGLFNMETYNVSPSLLKKVE